MSSPTVRVGSPRPPFCSSGWGSWVSGPGDKQRAVRFVSRCRHPPHLLRCFSGYIRDDLASDGSGESVPGPAVGSKLLWGQPLPHCLVLEGSRDPENLPFNAGLRVLCVQEFRSGPLQFGCRIASGLEYAHPELWGAVLGCMQVAPEPGPVGARELRRQRIAEFPHLVAVPGYGLPVAGHFLPACAGG